MDKYDRPTVGQVQEFNGKLLRAAASVIDGASPSELHALIAGDLINRQLRNIPFYRVWATVKIGGVEEESMVRSLETDGYFIKDFARRAIKNAYLISAPEEEKEVILARVKVGDLRHASGSIQERFDRGHADSPITFAVEALGGLPPSPEVALRLRIPDAYGRNRLWIPGDMPSKFGPKGVWFCLQRDGEERPWIDAVDTRGAFFWNERDDEEVLFIPRKLTKR